jgi:hypothetical protein
MEVATNGTAAYAPTGAGEELWMKYFSGWTDEDLYRLTFLWMIAVYVFGNLPFLVLDAVRLPFFEK